MSEFEASSAPKPAAFATRKLRAFFLPLVQFNAAQIARAAVIAALYACLTLALPVLSSGPIQCRFAECMTILPALLPEAVAGVTIGCLISNALSPLGWPNTVFGTLATLVAGILTYLIGYVLKRRASAAAVQPAATNLAAAAAIPPAAAKRAASAAIPPILAAIPPVVINALVVPLVIFSLAKSTAADYGIGAPVAVYLFTAATVAAGEAVAVYALGLPLYHGVRAYLRRTNGR